METAFGENFSDVQAHVGAGEATRSIGAVAAARGDVVAFTSTEPSVEEVAHELAHVVQGRRHGTSNGGRGLSRRDDAAEREAEAVATAVAEGRTIPAIHASAGTDDRVETAERASAGAETQRLDEALPAGSALPAEQTAPVAGTESTEGTDSPRSTESANAAAPEPPVNAEQPKSTVTAAEPGPPVGRTIKTAAEGRKPPAAPTIPIVPERDPAASRVPPLSPTAMGLQPSLHAMDSLSYRDLPESVRRVHNELRLAQERQRQALVPPAAIVDHGAGVSPPRPAVPTPDTTGIHDDAALATHRVRAISEAAHGRHARGASAEPAGAAPRRPGGHTSAGPRPDVPLHGAASPARTMTARASADRMAAGAHQKAKAAAAADHGERGVTAGIAPVKAQAPVRAVPAPELAAPAEPPTLSEGLGAALDTAMGGMLRARADEAKQRATDDHVRLNARAEDHRLAAEARLRSSAERSRATQTALEARSTTEVENMRTSWRAESDTLTREHGTRTEALHSARMKQAEGTLTHGNRDIDQHLTQAEASSDTERTAADERARSIRAAAEARAASARSSSGAPIMRQEADGGGSSPADANDGEAEAMRILAEAEEQAQDALEHAEALIAQLLQAAQDHALDQVARLTTELDALFAELEQQLHGATTLIEQKMPLVAQRFTTDIQGIVDSVKAEAQAAAFAAQTGDTEVLAAMQANLASDMAAHQATVGQIFNDVVRDWRIVDAAEAISARCASGDAFRRNPDGSYAADDFGNMIPNISAGEYALLFQAVEIQTGIPARLLKAIAEGEAVSSMHRDGIPRHFYDQSMISGMGTMQSDGKAQEARWALGEGTPPVAWGDDSQLDQDGDDQPDAGNPDTRGMGYMQLTAYGPDVIAAWHNGGTVKVAGVDVDVQRALMDPYYNITMAAAVLRQKQHDFAHLDWVSQDPQTDEEWALIGSLYQTRGGNGPGGGATERILNRMQLSEREHDQVTSGTASQELYYYDNTSTLPARDSAFANAELVVPSDPSVPIPGDLYSIDGSLYQLSDRGGRDAGFVPVSADTTIEMNGKFYAYVDGDLVEVPEPSGGNVIQASPLGPTGP
jgi:hypothetical protein